MPEVKLPVTISNLVQWAGLLVAASIAWAVLDNRVSVQASRIEDHESRLRTIERDFLVAFGELKGEFQGVKTRLSAIEKAVKP